MAWLGSKSVRLLRVCFFSREYERKPTNCPIASSIRALEQRGLLHVATSASRNRAASMAGDGGQEDTSLVLTWWHHLLWWRLHPVHEEGWNWCRCWQLCTDRRWQDYRSVANLRWEERGQVEKGCDGKQGIEPIWSKPFANLEPIEMSCTAAVRWSLGTRGINRAKGVYARPAGPIAHRIFSP